MKTFFKTTSISFAILMTISLADSIFKEKPMINIVVNFIVLSLFVREVINDFKND